MTRRTMDALTGAIQWFERHTVIIVLILAALGGISWLVYTLESIVTLIIALVIILALIFMDNFTVLLILLAAPLLMCASLLDLVLFTRFLLRPSNRISLVMLIPTGLVTLLIWLQYGQ